MKNHIIFDKLQNSLVHNSGENIIFERCVFAGAKNFSIIYKGAAMWTTFNNCSFDFNNGVFYNDSDSWHRVVINDGHIEDPFNIIYGKGGHDAYGINKMIDNEIISLIIQNLFCMTVENLLKVCKI